MIPKEIADWLAKEGFYQVGDYAGWNITYQRAWGLKFVAVTVNRSMTLASLQDGWEKYKKENPS